MLNDSYICKNNSKALTGLPSLALSPSMVMLVNFLKLMLVLVGLSQAQIVYGGVDKTLVSWVQLEDESVRAGSILTLQNGSEFDGIVFGELMEGKWMAGSDNWKRTEKNQVKYPGNDPEAGSLAQIAIVYQKNLISIFRDG